MLLANILFSIVSAWRITELFTLDRITERFRKRFPSYLWSCSRCLSVWAGIIVVLLYHYAPFVNWALAISWLYILQVQIINKVFTARDRQIVLDVDPNWNIGIQSKFQSPDILALLQRAIVGLQQQAKKDNGISS